jgi:hypothetical protein
VPGVLDPTDPKALLRRIAALERKVTALTTAAQGAQYAHDEGGGARTIATSPTSTYLNYTGAPSVTVAVPASGRVRVSWGFTGWNTSSATSTVRVAPELTGVNEVSPTAANSACAAGDNNGAGTDRQDTPRGASRVKVYEDLVPGSTTFTLRGRISSALSGATHGIQDSWLLVEPMP